MEATAGKITLLGGEAAAVLAVAGALDQSLAEALLEEVRRAVAEQPRVVMELGEVAAADSAGLGALIRSLKIARDAGGELALARPSPVLAELFDQTGLDTVFRIYPNIAEAQRALSA